VAGNSPHKPILIRKRASRATKLAIEHFLTPTQKKVTGPNVGRMGFLRGPLWLEIWRKSKVAPHPKFKRGGHNRPDSFFRV